MLRYCTSATVRKVCFSTAWFFGDLAGGPRNERSRLVEYGEAYCTDESAVSFRDPLCRPKRAYKYEYFPDLIAF